MAGIPTRLIITLEDGTPIIQHCPSRAEAIRREKAWYNGDGRYHKSKTEIKPMTSTEAYIYREMRKEGYFI